MAKLVSSIEMRTFPRWRTSIEGTRSSELNRNHEELALLVEAGLTPFEALRAGTADAALFLHAERDFGRVAPGLRADLILVDGNPLADVHHVSRASGVVLRGQWLPAAKLAAALDRLAQNRTGPRHHRASKPFSPDQWTT